jgi:hypothetical protein
LQAPVNKVWEAFDSRRAKPSHEGYRAWDYAPHRTVESKSHSPVFKTYDLSWWEKAKFYWRVQVREPFLDPWSRNYRPMVLVVALI